MSALTIDEVKERRKSLDNEILTLVQSFEEETGVRINWVNFRREENEYREPSRDSGKLLSVSTDMDLDLG